MKFTVENGFYLMAGMVIGILVLITIVGGWTNAITNDLQIDIDIKELSFDLNETEIINGMGNLVQEQLKSEELEEKEE